LIRLGSLLVAGTASDAGKSVLTAGICRWLARQGITVAPLLRLIEHGPAPGMPALRAGPCR
jgi:dethiobiotin synthetase